MAKTYLVKKTEIKKKPGMLYFVDKKGNVCACKMARGKSTRKKK